MAKLDGIHHLAFSTRNMKVQLQFFTDVLGLELVALFWMHGVEGAWHAFLRFNERSYLSFVYMPEMEKLDPVPGLSHADHQGAPSVGGSMQHLALRVDSPAEVLAMRDRVRSHGVQVFGQIEHGLCTSIYFAGPEGLNLEVACQGQLEPEAWIDPEVVALCGISESELANMRAPRPFVQPEMPVVQPPSDPAKPQLAYSEKVYARMLAMPDAELTRAASFTQPPCETALNRAMGKD
jgi:catechol 2,3-dioxygenase-like lactoylglutathione lyase family enzyme